MNKDTLKLKLLNTNLFLNNKYLDEYVELIIKNQNNKKVKYCTQVHHILPIKYFSLTLKRSLNRKDINDKKIIDTENLVNLCFSDHCLAHILLTKCTLGEFQESMIIAALHVYDNLKNKNLNYEDLLSDKYKKELDELYQKNIVNLSRKNKNKKRLYDSKGNEVYAFNDEQLNKYINEGYSLKPPFKKIVINKDGKTKRIPEDKLSQYLNEGWQKGFSLEKKAKHKNLVTIHLNNVEKHVSQNVLNNYLEQGWKKGRAENFKIINSKNKKGQIDITNDNNEHKRIYLTDLSAWESKGWYKGLPKNRKNIKMHKDNIEILVNESEVNKYIEKGFVRGISEKSKNMLQEIHLKNKGKEPWNKGKKISTEAIEKRKQTMKQRYPNGIKAIWSTESKAKIGEMKRGKISISKNKIIKYINETDLDLYLNQGWIRGRKG